MRKLTKTLMWALVGMGIGYFLSQNNESIKITMMIGMAGFPAGWKAVSKWGVIPVNIVGFTLQVVVSINVLEILSKEFKVHGLGSENNYADQGEETEQEGKKKNDKIPLIMNLFQKVTILKIRLCVEHYQDALRSEAICRRYPTIRDGLYVFLELNNMETIQQFSEEMSKKAMEAFAVRQDQGIAFMPLVDLFNTLKALAEYQDVYDNFKEFKLLMKYPKLTPYMYSFVEILHGLIYWPLFVLYFMFEVSRIVFTNLHELLIPVFFIVFIGSNWLFTKIWGVENLLVFRHIFLKAKWYAFLDQCMGTVNNSFDAIILSVMLLIMMLLIYLLSSVAITVFLAQFADDLNKGFDWKGLGRTFQNIFQQIKNYIINRES